MTKTAFDSISDYGTDFKNRRIYFGVAVAADTSSNHFEWLTVEIVIRALHKLAADNSKRPIELHMSSPGGSPESMFRLIDEILSCPCKIIFVGGGEISSCATWIMAIFSRFKFFSRELI